MEFGLSEALQIYSGGLGILAVFLGDVPADAVQIELYSDHDNGRMYPMHRDAPIAGAHNGFRYTASVPADRPVEHYTARAVPFHPNALLPIEAPDVLWLR